MAIRWDKFTVKAQEAVQRASELVFRARQSGGAAGASAGGTA